MDHDNLTKTLPNNLNNNSAYSPTMSEPEKRNWRRASTVNRAGETVAISYDWLLFDAYGQQLGRITRQRSGPVAGKWNWYVFVNGEGYAAGVSGMADDGPAAKAAVEERIPLGTYHRDAKHNGDREFRRQRAVARRKGKL